MRYPTLPVSPVRELCLLLAAFVCFRLALAHEGHLGDVFHAESLPKAIELAKKEHKLVFLYATRRGVATISYLERPTAREEPLLDLLTQETVIAVVDVEQAALDVSRYQPLAPPETLVLEPDGSVLFRVPGDVAAEALFRTLDAALQSPSAVQRARAALTDKGEKDYLARERLARALLRAGLLPEALEEFERCAEAALQAKRGIAIGRRRLLLRAFADLCDRHPPARAALDRRRDEIERLLAGDRDDPILARDFAEVNHWLTDDARTLALYERLPAERACRDGLFDRIFNDLLERRRYAELLQRIDPLAAFRGERNRASGRGQIWIGQSRADGPQRGTRAFAVARGAGLLETLAASGRIADARSLLREIIEFDDRPATRELLRAHLQRAGASALLDELSALPQATTVPASPAAGER